MGLLGWLFGSGADPGRTYPRGGCEVCYQVTRKGKDKCERAIVLQYEWIRRMKPRDNQIGAEEPLPF